MARKPAASLHTLTLEGDLDVFSIHQQWEKAQSLGSIEGGQVELNLATLGDLDLSGIQLLCSLDRDLRARGAQVTLLGVKDEWKARFMPLGMAHLFSGGSS